MRKNGIGLFVFGHPRGLPPRAAMDPVAGRACVTSSLLRSLVASPPAAALSQSGTQKKPPGMAGRADMGGPHAKSMVHVRFPPVAHYR